MIRIMICDSNEEKITAIRTILKDQSQNYPGEWTIDIRRDLLQLLYDMDEGLSFDIILMDTVYRSKSNLFPEQSMDGLQAAEKIRLFLPDSLIVFVSAHTEKVFDAFRVPAFRFIPEQEMSDRLPEMLHQAYQLFEKNASNSIFLETTKGLQRICINDIVSCERMGNYVLLEMISGVNHKVRGSLSSFRRRLPYDNFIEVNRILVNPAFIQCAEGQDILLQDGRLLHAAKGQKKRLMSAVLSVLLSIILSLTDLTLLVLRKEQNFTAVSGGQFLSEMLPCFIGVLIYLMSGIIFAIICKRDYRKAGLFLAVLLSEFALFQLIQHLL